MEPNSDAQEFAVLFVDDEGPSCDVLCDALAGRLRVITADSVDKALAVLERQGHDIGVLLTDQRMPGRSGVDLLKLVRERWPSIVRLLTTAYTDYDDAIAAVNRGEILRYIHKPWDIRTLRMELEHAMELFVLRQERERLIEEKLSTRQRLVEAGRARDLLVLCAALGLRDTAAAVGDFLAQTSAGNPSGGPSSLGRIIRCKRKPCAPSPLRENCGRC
ncbi:response regulator [Methylogaea oryzae]|uniref:response regulator n=1 Tax=Methylogaea oryzae TaxID=1295382 RepID=UPI0006D07F51|nr:response regulator [Methylogaea oryzae]